MLGNLVQWVVEVVYSFGYPGVAVLMVLSNLFLPIPSEVVLPFAGFLVGQGLFSLPLVLLAATGGAVVSALVLYFVGRRLGEDPCGGLSDGTAGSCFCASRTSTGRADGSRSTAGRPS